MVSVDAVYFLSIDHAIENKPPRNTTAYVCAFRRLNESFEVITVCTQNWIAVRRAFSSSNVAIFIRL